MKKSQGVEKDSQLVHLEQFSNKNIENNSMGEKNPSFLFENKIIKKLWQKKKLKVALVHDFLVNWGGAEKVLEDLAKIFPEAPIYTLIYDKEKMRGKFSNKNIRTSFLQKFPKFIKYRFRRYLLPFMPTIPETFDLRDFDLVISSSGAWSKGIVTRLNTVHIAYIHSPMRFVWDYSEKYLQDIGKKIGFCKRLFLSYLRVWDYQAAQRPDILIANSKYTQERIKKYYRRESQVIHPSLSEKFSKNKETKKQNNAEIVKTRDIFNNSVKNYFLVVSRLSAYKKIDLVVEAFNKLELPLVVIGEGDQKKYLQKIAQKNVKILGWKSDKELKKYYQDARAFIFPTIDDFGLTIIEAMSFGVPVIAIRKGGAKEILKENVTGEFFDAQTVEVLSDGVRRFLENEKKYSKSVITKRAKDFSISKFKKQITSIISQ